MSYEVGDTYASRITVRDENGVLADPASRALSVKRADGTLLSAEAAEALIEHPSTGVYQADVPLTSAGMWVVGWDATNPARHAQASVWVHTAMATLLCTPEDLAARWGRPLTTTEEPVVAMLCDSATVVIAGAVDSTPAVVGLRAASIPLLRVVAIELVSRAAPNPGALASTSETLGQYTYTQRWNTTVQGAGLWLTDRETMLVRRAVHGRLSATSMPGTTLDQGIELVTEGDIS